MFVSGCHLPVFVAGETNHSLTQEKEVFLLHFSLILMCFAMMQYNNMPTLPSLSRKIMTTFIIVITVVKNHHLHLIELSKKIQNDSSPKL